jgi:hypothetical protein
MPFDLKPLSSMVGILCVTSGIDGVEDEEDVLSRLQVPHVEGGGTGVAHVPVTPCH